MKATSTPRCDGANGVSRRAAFSSCRVQPISLPRPAWYQATTTCTSPWKKSFSAGGAARQTSSSASCAAKYSPARASSRPRSRSCSTLVPTVTECYPRAAVATILLAGVDLFIRGKLEASLPGHLLVTSDSLDPPDLVIADVGRVDPYDVADAYPDVPLLGFTNHKDTAGLRRANEAGFDQVVAKSALDERAQQLIDGLVTPVD